MPHASNTSVFGTGLQSPLLERRAETVVPSTAGATIALASPRAFVQRSFAYNEELSMSALLRGIGNTSAGAAVRTGEEFVVRNHKASGFTSWIRTQRDHDREPFRPREVRKVICRLCTW